MLQALSKFTKTQGVVENKRIGHFASDDESRSVHVSLVYEI